MSYERILRRAFEIVSSHGFLIVLGAVAALGSGSNFNGFSAGGDRSNGQGVQTPAFQFDGFDTWAAIPLVLILALIGIAILVAFAVWAVSTLARGGVVAGVDAIESGRATNFSLAWNEAWQKGWRLLGIGLVPAIPLLILVVLGLIALVATVGLAGLASQARMLAPAGMGAATLLVGAACLLLPLTLALLLLRTFAERACIIEDLDTLAAYRRGWQVLATNLGPALILFVIQVGIGIAIGVLLFLPSLLMTICCILWPLLLLIQGAIHAYFSSVWTLAWREWTATTPAAGNP